VTVFNDTHRDQLKGGSGSDWFFASLTGVGTNDRVFDLKPNQGDVLSELD
jgi:hypothetical protein